jgi:hypothetical protein
LLLKILSISTANVAKVSKELGFHFNHVLGDSPILVQAGAVEIANLLLQMVYEF